MSEQTEICSICCGSGWAPAEIAGTVRRCSCRDAFRLERLFADARIPKRYEHCNLDNYKPNDKKEDKEETQQRAKVLVGEVLDHYPFVTGILFLGPCGVGKTHLAVAFLKQVIERFGDSGLFYDFRDLLRDIQSSWNAVSRTSEMDVLRPVLDARVLVLDELGANKPTEWVMDTVAHIINCRYNDNKITVFTSNFLDKPEKPGEYSLTDRVGARLRSRLYEMCRDIEIKGEDYRQKAGKKKNQLGRINRQETYVSGLSRPK